MDQPTRTTGSANSGAGSQVAPTAVPLPPGTLGHRRVQVAEARCQAANSHRSGPPVVAPHTSAVSPAPRLRNATTVYVPSCHVQAVPGPSGRPEVAPVAQATPQPAAGLCPRSHIEFVERPWLTADQNAKRQELDRRLRELWSRPNLAWYGKAGLYHGVTDVTNAEQDALFLHELMNQANDRLLSETEWREARRLTERIRAILPSSRDEMVSNLDRLASNNELGLSEATLLKESLQQLIAANDFITSDALPWRAFAKRIRVALPTGEDEAALVESRVVPGRNFAPHVVAGYAWDDGADAVTKALSVHVPELAKATLINNRGQVLFSGLSHAFLHFPEFDGRALAGLPDERLSTLVGELYLSRQPKEQVAAYRNRVAWTCRVIRERVTTADRMAATVQSKTQYAKAIATLTAALVADEKKFAQALLGNPVQLNLFSIALLTPESLQPYMEQHQEFSRLANLPAIGLTVIGPGGNPNVVYVSVRIRQFLLAVDEQLDVSVAMPGRPQVPGHPAPFGKEEFNLLGWVQGGFNPGDVRSSVTSRIAVIKAMDDLIATEDQRHRSAFEQSGADSSQTLETARGLSELRARRARCFAQSCTLEEVSQQLRTLWRPVTGWPTGEQALTVIAPRLALIGYLLGETPLVSCAAGSGLAGILDEEVKFLATVADAQGGHAPPVHLDVATWGTARSAFTSP